MNEPINVEMAAFILQVYNITNIQTVRGYVRKANEPVKKENEERIKNGLEPIIITPGITTVDRFSKVKPELTKEYILKRIKEFKKEKDTSGN